MISKVNRAIVLAAGRGKRLGYITDLLPKPMVCIAGQPLLEYAINDLKSSGITEILLVVGYRLEDIISHFGNGSKFGVSLTYVTQEIPNGTGSAIALGAEFAKNEPVFVRFGDIFTSPQHTLDLLKDYEDNPCDALLGCNFVEDPFAGAAVYRDGDRIVRIVEKPAPGTSTSNWNPGGLYIFGPRLMSALGTLPVSPRGEYEVTSAYQTVIDNGGDIRVHEMHGYWSDVGTEEAYIEARNLAQSAIPSR